MKKILLNDLSEAARNVLAGVGKDESVVADPKDDMIIAAALESRASYIVSEDKHLLDLNEYQGIKIMNREDFEAELDRLGGGAVGDCQQKRPAECS